MQHGLARVDVDPRDPSFYQNPYASYAQWHDQHPRFFWSAYQCVCFAGFADVDQILRDRRFGRVFGSNEHQAICPVGREHLQNFDALEKHSLLNLEPPRHPAMRKLLSRAFVSSKVERLRPEILAIANSLLDKMEPKEECDLLQEYLMPLPALVIARLIGVSDEMVPNLVSWSHAMVKMYTMTQSAEDERLAESAARSFRDYLILLIAQKKQYADDSLLFHLLQVELDSKKLREDEIISTLVLLLNAGHEATVHQSGNAVKAIFEQNLNPVALFASDHSTGQFVEEVMRFDAPLHVFVRFALEKIDMGDGLVLEPGQKISLLFGAANRDPARFGSPECLTPGRADAWHIALGAGIHFCLGAPLARLEMQLSLALLFHRFPLLHLREKPLYADSFHFHGLQSLRVGLQ